MKTRVGYVFLGREDVPKRQHAATMEPPVSAHALNRGPLISVDLEESIEVGGSKDLLDDG